MTEPIKPSNIDELVSSFKTDGYHLNSRFVCEFSIIPLVFQKAISNNFGSNRDFASLVAKECNGWFLQQSLCQLLMLDPLPLPFKSRIKEIMRDL